MPFSSMRSVESPPSLPRTIARLLLGAFLLYTGTAHLTFGRAEFVAQVPRVLPLNPDFVVVASGVVELALGLALIALKRDRVLTGFIVAAFFIAIFPGNVAQYLNHSDAFGLDTDGKRFGRLFFQLPLVLWALWCTDAWSWLKQRRAARRAREAKNISAHMSCEGLTRELFGDVLG